MQVMKAKGCDITHNILLNFVSCDHRHCNDDIFLVDLLFFTHIVHYL